MTIAAGRLESCPKIMTFGPCGGVKVDGSCEVSPHPCIFLETPTVRWADASASSAPRSLSLSEREFRSPSLSTRDEPSAGRTIFPIQMRLSQRDLVIADFPGRALDTRSTIECAEALAGSVDAVLAGDSGDARVQFSPTWRAHLIRSAGVLPWTGLNCRDRNRVALEGELAGLAEVGVAGIHCVTGDHTLTGQRPDAKPVFDVDSTELAALAASAGHLVSVGESPLTPPTSSRAARLLEKQHAGASICFVNHAGGAEPVAEFIADARALGVTMSFIPCVPVILDRGSAELMLTFTTLVLPPGYLEGILSARDTRCAGISAAVALSREMLEIDGVTGVNLSGGPSGGDRVRFARDVAEIAREIR